MNQNIRKVMDAVALLRGVAGCELEVQSLSHKIQAMYSEGKEGKEGRALIDCMDDDELAAAIRMNDERIGFGRFIDPCMFNYIRYNRPVALHRAEQMRKGVY